MDVDQEKDRPKQRALRDLRSTGLHTSLDHFYFMGPIFSIGSQTAEAYSKWRRTRD